PPAVSSLFPYTTLFRSLAKPPRMLVLPPVTLPLARVIGPAPVVVIVPSFAPTKPPAALEFPTVTLPVAKELMIVALLSAPVPGLTHSEHLLGMLLATSPPAVPLLPVSTLPVAKDRSILPLFSPT